MANKISHALDLYRRALYALSKLPDIENRLAEIRDNSSMQHTKDYPSFPENGGRLICNANDDEIQGLIKSLTHSHVAAVQQRINNYFVSLHKQKFGECETPISGLLSSQVARRLDFQTHGRWCDEMHQKYGCNRKFWEWLYIAQALYERGKMVDGNTGIGFACGTEPLPALFSKYGVKVTASEFFLGEHYNKTGEFSEEMEQLVYEQICDPKQFYQNTNFRRIDMNNLPNDINGKYDFCWSSCAFEHIGTIEDATNFVINSLNCLKNNGVAVHTTEYRIDSEKTYTDVPNNNSFGLEFFKKLEQQIVSYGHSFAPLDLRLGTDKGEDRVFLNDGITPLDHESFKLNIGESVSTSIGIIITKNN